MSPLVAQAGLKLLYLRKTLYFSSPCFHLPSTEITKEGHPVFVALGTEPSPPSLVSKISAFFLLMNPDPPFILSSGRFLKTSSLRPPYSIIYAWPCYWPSGSWHVVPQYCLAMLPALTWIHFPPHLPRHSHPHKVTPGLHFLGGALSPSLTSP